MTTERMLAPGVLQLELPSATLRPFTTTWATLIHSGGRGTIVDPGFHDPEDAANLVTWAQAHGAHDIDRILLTHTHRDHVMGVPALLEHLGPVPIHVHPLEADRVPGGGQIVPTGHDRVLILGDLTVRALHTPGHAIGHLAFLVEGPSTPAGVLVGDLLSGLGSTWVGLPEGDVRAYMSSMRAIRALQPKWLGVAHGPVVEDPVGAIDAVLTHREARELALLENLHEPRTLQELLHAVYGAVDASMNDMVRAVLLANLAALLKEQKVMLLGENEEGPYLQASSGHTP